MTPAPVFMAFRQALGEAFARGAGPLLPLAFFTGAAVLVPFGIGTDAERLQGIAPGLAFALMALSSLVTLERLFQSDLEDGALDLWVQSEAPLAIIASAKTLAHWLAAGLPLALATPLLQLMFQAEANAALLMHAALAALGSLAFYFWGGVGAALAAGVRRGGLLISLLVLPLYIPTAIFGALALGGQTESHTALLGLAAATLFALGLAPFAMAAALRLAAD